jgi:hypothetical protein
MAGQFSALFVAMSPRCHCRAALDWIRDDRRGAPPDGGFMGALCKNPRWRHLQGCADCMFAERPRASILPFKTRSAFAMRAAAPSRFQ